jgi:hypothetical protein
MTRQAPLGRISRLWLWSVHHRCRRPVMVQSRNARRVKATLPCAGR